MGLMTADDPQPKALLRQERSRETRRKLLEAAQELWTRDGFDETTVDDICKEAGVAKGTFYFHFPQKEDALVGLADSAINELADELLAAAQREESIEECFNAFANSMARRLQEMSRPLLTRSVAELFRSMGRGWWAKPIAAFTAAFQKAQERGEIAKTYRPEELATIALQLVLQAILFWSRQSRGRTGLQIVLRRRLAFVLAGARG